MENRKRILGLLAIFLIVGPLAFADDGTERIERRIEQLEEKLAEAGLIVFRGGTVVSSVQMERVRDPIRFEERLERRSIRSNSIPSLENYLETLEAMVSEGYKRKLWERYIPVQFEVELELDVLNRKVSSARINTIEASEKAGRRFIRTITDFFPIRSKSRKFSLRSQEVRQSALGTIYRLHDAAEIVVSLQHRHDTLAKYIYDEKDIDIFTQEHLLMGLIRISARLNSNLEDRRYIEIQLAKPGLGIFRHAYDDKDMYFRSPDYDNEELLERFLQARSES